MQSELPAVSQHKPSVDSSPTHPTSTQHGNVFADGPVSGPHRPEATGDSTASDQLMPVGNHALLDGAKAASPWAPVSRVIQHENAHAPGKKSAELGFRVVPSANYSPQALESLPNGMLELKCPANQLRLTILQRSSPIFCRICLLSPFRPSP